MLACRSIAAAEVSGAWRIAGDGGALRGEYQQQPLSSEHGAAKGDPSYAAPEQVHISLASPGYVRAYPVTVAWVTWPDVRSEVLWGTAADDLVNVARGSSTTYSARHPGRADYTSGFLHSATLEGLQPSSTYFYSCGDSTLAMSTVRSFVTPPKFGPEQAITLGIIGDLGQTDNSAATLEAIDGDVSLDLVLHAGDLSYADCDHPRWDSFMRMLDPVASRLPWMVGPGNHEIETNGAYPGTKPFLAYERRFRMPAVLSPTIGYGCGTGGGLDGDGVVCGEGFGAEEADAAANEVATRLVAGLGGDGVPAGDSVGAAVRQASREARKAFDATRAGVSLEVGEEGDVDVDGSGDQQPVSCCPSEWSGTYDYGNSFYSFDVGPAHVLVLNPYTATGENSIQYAWLQKDLEFTDRTVTPWLIVMMHCPWYNSNLAHQGERQAETAMRAIEPILYQHKAAIIIAGHVHAYERSHPVVDFELTEDGPVHLVVGGAGNREGHAGANVRSVSGWSAFRDGTVYGSGRLSIQSSSLALWEWKSSEEAAGLHDVAWISNPYSPYAPGESRDEEPLDATGGVIGGNPERGSGSGSVSVSRESEHELGGQGGIAEKTGLRIPSVAPRHTHRVTRD
ncbi:unnamed protein product [Scytosiphon promiscuus]